MPFWHNTKHDYFVFDEVDRLTVGAQRSLRSTMDLKRCMYFLTTNHLNKIDQGIINRCHLIEMNQITTLSAYVPLGQAILQSMGISSSTVTAAKLQKFAKDARGSLRDFSNSVVLEGIAQGGALT